MPLTDVHNHAGAEGTFTVAGIVWDIEDFSITESSEKQRTTTTRDYVAGENRTYRRSQATEWYCEGQFVFPWDSKKPPIPALRSGSDVAATMKTFDGLTFNFPSILLGNMQIAAGGTAGIYKVTVPFESNGPYTMTVVTG